MIDIAIVALPADRVAAARIADELIAKGVAGVNRTRLIVEHPAGLGWREAKRAIDDTPCVIFCWGRGARARDAAPLIALAARTAAEGRAIAVEFASGAAPALPTTVTTYPLYGPNWLHRLIYGAGHLTDIAAAAQQKVIGRDPPPPSASRLLAWRQFRIRMIALGALIGIASALFGFWSYPGFAKWRDGAGQAAYAKARRARNCDALRKFDQDSAWAGDAAILLGTCARHDAIRVEHRDQPLRFYAEDADEARRQARQLCADHARIARGRVTGQRISFDDPGAARGDGTVICTLEQPVTVVVETMGGR